MFRVFVHGVRMAGERCRRILCSAQLAPTTVQLSPRAHEVHLSHLEG